jgi:hypothetical protein
MIAMHYLRAAAVSIVISILAGCSCCPVNKKTGIPVIMCQPEDAIIRTSQTAKFSVTVEQPHCDFRWIHIASDGHGGSTETAVREDQNASSSVLSVPGTQADADGLYYCVIDNELGRSSRTRDASLIVIRPIPPPIEKNVKLDKGGEKYGSAPMFLTSGSVTNTGGGTNPQLSTKILPSYLGTGTFNCNGTPFTYQNTVRYTTQDTTDGTVVKLHSPTAATGGILHLSKVVGGIPTLVANTSWVCTWTTINHTPTTFCTIPSTTDLNARTFTFPSIDQNTDFSFTVYFGVKDIGATYQLSLQWTP